MRLLTLLFAFLTFTVSAQQSEAILFNEKSFDFGEITEDGGHADHEFIFTNNTGRVFNILNVQASCGCTTPGWTRDPVQPGKTGFIKASFDPKGRPGYFLKSLTVTTDYDSNPVVLTIKGTVAGAKPSTAPADYPVEIGSLRFKFNSFPLGKISINQLPAVREFPVYNAGPVAVNFTGKVTGPPYIRITTPSTVLPGEKSTIKVTYDAKMKNKYGFVSDNVEIETDDTTRPGKSFSVYATIEEYFPPSSFVDMGKAPVLQIDMSTIDFGKIRQGNTLEQEVLLKNTGKSDLLIRAVQGNCTCIKGRAESMKIKAGTETKLKITFDTQGRSGIQQKAVTVYSNDPRNPVQRVTLSGLVEN